VSFEEYVAARLPALLRYAVLLTGDPHLAEDLVQDVLISAHGRWRRIVAGGSPDRYVQRMVTNAYLSWRRRWNTATAAGSPGCTSTACTACTS
jgi:DNA-directed RNA polymerase specialized sigma24 family protein